MVEILLIVTLFIGKPGEVQTPKTYISAWNGFEDCIKAGENLAFYFGDEYTFSCEYHPPLD